MSWPGDIPGKVVNHDNRLERVEAALVRGYNGGTSGAPSGPTGGFVVPDHGHGSNIDGGILTAAIFFEGAAPSTPPAGYVYVYAKTDSLIYQKNDTGTETVLTGAGGGGGAVATDAIWDAMGDAVRGTGANTAERLAITVPAANIINVLGVVNGETTFSWKSLMDATVATTQAFGDAAAAGTGVLLARIAHKHAMPADPVTAHVAAGNPHPDYLTDAEHSAIASGPPHHEAVTLSAAADGLLGITAQQLTLDAQAAGRVIAGPVFGADAAPTARALVNRDLPTNERALQSLLAVLAESYPRWAINANTNLLSSGRLSCVSIPVKAGTPCTNGSFSSATTAASVPTNWWMALCDSTLKPIRQSTDQLTAAWAANTLKTLALDSIPVTAGARAASTTVTLTFPTVSEALTDLIAVGDSITVSNANIAAYNGTFTVVTVSATQITYVAGGSATDSLAAPFPTVRLAAGKRVYTPAADALVYLVLMVVATTVPTLMCFTILSGAGALAPVLAASGNTGLTGTVPSPITTATASGVAPWGAVS